MNCNFLAQNQRKKKRYGCKQQCDSYLINTIYSLNFKYAYWFFTIDCLVLPFIASSLECVFTMQLFAGWFEARQFSSAYFILSPLRLSCDGVCVCASSSVCRLVPGIKRHRRTNQNTSIAIPTAQKRIISSIPWFVTILWLPILNALEIVSFSLCTPVQFGRCRFVYDENHIDGAKKKKEKQYCMGLTMWPVVFYYCLNPLYKLHSSPNVYT